MNKLLYIHFFSPKSLLNINRLKLGINILYYIRTMMIPDIFLDMLPSKISANLKK